MSYLPCELHTHTVHSDGNFTPYELQKAAAENELSLIALTDHNTTSGIHELDSRLLPFIGGIEWTTYFGHMLVLGSKKTVDWRDAEIGNIDRKIREVKEAGGTVGIAHPFQAGAPICTGGRWEFDVKDFSRIDYIEIWHEGIESRSYENENGCRFWTELLDRGYRIAATYGRDWHRPSDEKQYGCTYLNFENEVSEKAALDAIQKGRTVVSSGARFFFQVLQNGQIYHIGDTLKAGEAVFRFYTDEYARSRMDREKIAIRYIRLVTNHSECVLESSITRSETKVTLQSGHWYRAELWGTINGQETMIAVTSPVYTEQHQKNETPKVRPL